MNYLELLTLLDSNKECVLADKATEIITDRNRYTKYDSKWQVDTHPGKPVSTAGRGGIHWTWQRDVEEEPTPKVVV